MGEFGAIDLFRQVLASRAPASALQAVIDIGDDAAAWQPAVGRLALQTTDLVIEDVHFSLATAGWYDVGWKAMAVNLSDVAAMGGRPRAAFVSAGLKPDMAQADARALYEGLADCAAEFQTAILGGDTVASPRAAVVGVALYGESADDSGAVLRRDSAQSGDAVGVSGSLGASAAFLRCPEEPAFRRAHLRPQPRVELGLQLVKAGVRSAMDISDGLAADLEKICVASCVGACIELGRVPIDARLQQRLPEEAVELALSGGEDYELLVCGDSAVLDRAGLTLIGTIEPGQGVRILDEHGSEIALRSRGYDAFRGTP